MWLNRQRSDLGSLRRGEGRAGNRRECGRQRDLIQARVARKQIQVAMDATDVVGVRRGVDPAAVQVELGGNELGRDVLEGDDPSLLAQVQAAADTSIHLAE